MTHHEALRDPQTHVLARIVLFIRDHGCPCRVLPDGRLKVAMSFGCPTYKGFHWEISEIPGTLRAAREYLGY